MITSYDPDMTLPSAIWCGAVCYGRCSDGSDGSHPMTQAPIKLARLVAIAWCTAHLLATGACARHTPSSDSAAPAPAPAPETRGPVTLRVTNSNWSDVRIYLVRGAMWTRLGIVTTNSTIDFTIPADLLSGATSVTL